jgi:hypothetical protein
VALGTDTKEPDESGDNTVAHGLPINNTPTPKAIYSVKLNALKTGENIKARGELQVSRCNDPDTYNGSGNNPPTGSPGGRGDLNSPCEDIPNPPRNGWGGYMYNPEVGLRLVLATQPGATQGVDLSNGWQKETCSQNKHHCALTVTGNLSGTSVPTATGNTTYYINLLAKADANGSNPGPDDVVELESECRTMSLWQGYGPFEDYSDCDSYPTDNQVASKGKLSVIRLAATHGTDTSYPLANPTNVPSLEVGAGKKVLRALKLPTGLTPGSVIDVNATLKSEMAGGAQNRALLRSVLVLSDDNTATSPSGSFDHYLSADNGFNCEPNGQTCTSEKVGAVKIPSGIQPTTQLYVNYVATAIFTPQPGDHVQNQSLDMSAIVRDPSNLGPSTP